MGGAIMKGSKNTHYTIPVYWGEVINDKLEAFIRKYPMRKSKVHILQNALVVYLDLAEEYGIDVNWKPMIKEWDELWGPEGKITKQRPAENHEDQRRGSGRS